ncbi:hypothetical protein MKK55_07540 [Methylobacterium sp. J-059]|uniref:hypothetical protein n=1 Tax=Methylobacterium sp. J-059 TaxID=2836643 RepID=UPI001FB9ADCB|nr:hypothetical protein [Methylobacterium sp. J-059]MCJ2038808.1 hypothetical protein [Methylobacterium sp. J-059]
MASLPHDFHDVAGLIQKGEYVRNSDRTAFIDIDLALTSAEIKSAIEAYQNSVGLSEKVSTPISTASRVNMNLEYDEIDYSRTRLIQRQKKHADFVFDTSDAITRVRFPATDKARNVLEEIKNFISAARRADIPIDALTVSDLTSEADRTAFFMNILSNMPGYRVRTITDVRVAKWNEDPSELGFDDDNDDQETEAARASMLSVVNSVSMRGQNLTLTEEYKNLLTNGFFLTSITWRADQFADPRDLVQFEISFEDGIQGTNFRYAVRYSPRREGGDHGKTMLTVPELRKIGLLKLIEETARGELKKIRDNKAKSATQPKRV